MQRRWILATCLLGACALERTSGTGDAEINEASTADAGFVIGPDAAYDDAHFADAHLNALDADDADTSDAREEGDFGAADGHVAIDSDGAIVDSTIAAAADGAVVDARVADAPIDGMSALDASFVDARFEDFAVLADGASSMDAHVARDASDVIAADADLAHRDAAFEVDAGGGGSDAAFVETEDAAFGSYDASLIHDAATDPCADFEATVEVTHVMCPTGGTRTGSLTISASGGTPPYFYTAYGVTPTGSSATFSLLPEGTYSPRVADSNGCLLDLGDVALEQHDTVDPIARCRTTPLVVQLDADGEATVSVGQVESGTGSTDNCGVVSRTLSATSFQCDDTGSSQSVTLTVADAEGNESSCDVSVTVQDVTTPTALCNEGVEVSLDADGLVTVAASAINNGSYDNCGVASVSLSGGDLSCSDLGTNTVTLVVTDTAGVVGICQTDVLVEDVTIANVAPIVSCVETVDVPLNSEGTVEVTPWMTVQDASDNCGHAETVSPNAFGCGDVGATVAVTTTTTDPAGNEATCETSVTILDSDAPSMACTNISIQLDGDGLAYLAGTDLDAGSYDACGIESYVLSVDGFACADLGEQSVTLTVTDVNGQHADCVSTVTVEDIEAPTTQCQDFELVLDESGAGTLSPLDIDASSYDNCNIASMHVSQEDFTTDHLGPNTVTLYALDDTGNEGVCDATVTVVSPD